MSCQKGWEVLCTPRFKTLPLDLQHQIPSGDILHNKINPRLRLKATMQIEQKRMTVFIRHKEPPFLTPRALNLIILHNKLLLEHLDRIQLPCLFGLCEHDLSEITFSQDSEEIEIFEAD